MINAARRQTTTRSGITLIETVVSLVIISVLVLGLSSSVMLGARAMPSGTELGVADREVQNICNLLRDDISNAIQIQSQKSGSTLRFTLTMQSTGALGQGSQVVYELIPAAKLIRRRVDARSYESLTMIFDDFTIDINKVDSVIHYVHLVLECDATIQKKFELFVITPYGPEAV